MLIETVERLMVVEGKIRHGELYPVYGCDCSGANKPAIAANL